MIKGLVFAASVFATNFVLATTQITNPEQMETCLQQYIQQRIAPTETLRWEHPPRFEFAGKYFHASWHSSPIVKYGIMFASVAPGREIYCDYPVLNDLPQRENGFCKANVQDGKIQFEYKTFVKDGKEVIKIKNIGFIQDSKLFCFL